MAHAPCWSLRAEPAWPRERRRLAGRTCQGIRSGRLGSTMRKNLWKDRCGRTSIMQESLSRLPPLMHTNRTARLNNTSGLYLTLLRPSWLIQNSLHHSGGFPFKLQCTYVTASLRRKREEQNKRARLEEHCLHLFGSCNLILSIS